MAQSASSTFKGRMQAALYYARQRRRARWFAQLPTVDPAALGVLWNDNGTIKTSQG